MQWEWIIVIQMKVHITSLLDKEPNIDANRFLKLLKEFDELLLDECTTRSKLSTITWVFTIKLDYSLSGVGHGNVIE